MLGHLGSKEIPIFGVKTLGVRDGLLDLHGAPRKVVWTVLEQTAAKGENTVSFCL